jgi:hypothetical protein
MGAQRRPYRGACLYITNAPGMFASILNGVNLSLHFMLQVVVPGNHGKFGENAE